MGCRHAAAVHEIHTLTFGRRCHPIAEIFKVTGGVGAVVYELAGCFGGLSAGCGNRPSFWLARRH